MKTLDEVIEILERQIDKTRIKILDKDLLNSVPDALHYLKTIETTENLYHDAVNELSKWKDEDWKDRCLPLTWEELKQMEGKPVWTTFDNKYGTWCIAKVYDDEVVLYECGQEFGEILSGAWDYTPKRWQAYRKERE